MSESSSSETAVPVLFIVFNRPDVTAMAFSAIRAARPSRLYVAADGPRLGADEELLCQQVREIATDVDWDCSVQTLFQETNIGCRFGVQAAIDWFFANEECGIILEDDCLPDQSFFGFASSLLGRYRDDPRVMMISGDYFAGKSFDNKVSYYFTRYAHIWGWATWRRAWANCDPRLSDWPRIRETNWLLQVAGNDMEFVAYWQSVFDRVHAGEIDTWDYAWVYAMWRAGGLSAQSTRNLVSNVGFGVEATHTVDTAAWQSQLPIHPMNFPLVHPPTVTLDAARDRWTEYYVFGSHRPSTVRRVTDRLRNLR